MPLGASPVRGVAGLCFKFTDGDFPSSSKEGGCFSSCSAGCSSSWFCCLPQGTAVYRAPGFYEFDVGSSNTPVDTEFIS